MTSQQLDFSDGTNIGPQTFLQARDYDMHVSSNFEIQRGVQAQLGRLVVPLHTLGSKGGI